MPMLQANPGGCAGPLVSPPNPGLPGAGADLNYIAKSVDIYETGTLDTETEAPEISYFCEEFHGSI